MAFKFSLQTLLNIREKEEEKREQEFTVATQEKIKVEEKIDDLKNKYEKNRYSRGKENVIMMKMRNEHSTFLSNEITNQKIELKKKNEILEDKRKSLLKSQKDRKTVETLRDKKYEEFIKDENKKEQNANDEFALYGFIRNIERR
jgi:flagellar FliJ protein